MKRIPALALLTIAASLAVPGAMAQGIALKANVPFAFEVGETHLPAGKYLISSPVPGLIRIENTENKSNATITTIRGHNESPKGSRLVFERYGRQTFLHRILCPATVQMNVDVAAWKPERNARSREAKLQKGEEVLVAAN